MDFLQLAKVAEEVGRFQDMFELAAKAESILSMTHSGSDSLVLCRELIHKSSTALSLSGVAAMRDR